MEKVKIAKSYFFKRINKQYRFSLQISFFVLTPLCFYLLCDKISIVKKIDSLVVALK